MRVPLVVAAVILTGCPKHESATPHEGSAPAPPSPPPVTQSPPATTPADGPLELPAGKPGIGFDDMRFSPRLGVLVPAGRSGNLDVIDPKTRAVRALGGFSQQADYSGGHDDSVTSVDDTGDALAATDRTARTVVVLAPDTGAVIATAKLAAGPDYVRWVAPTGELWITEPDAEQIEIFKLADGKLATTKADRIAVKGGPESLVIDPQRKRAFTHLWEGSTVAIDLAKRTIVATWTNHCKGSRGIALDAARGQLFVGCAEGGVTVLDVDHDGALLGQAAPAGLGHLDIIDYSPTLHHVYLSSTAGTIAIVGIDAKGAATALGTVDGAKGSHCSTTDGAGTIFACDPPNGRVIVRTDTYPAS